MATKSSRGRGDNGDVHRVLNSIRSIVKTLRVADRASLQRHGIGAAQLYVLHQLSAQEPLSVGEVAELTATDQSTVSVVVNKLVAKGYVTSERSSEDARRAVLTLSPRGRKLAAKLPLPFQETLLAGIRQLSPARLKTLASSLEEIVHAIGGEEEHPPMLFEDEKPVRRRRS